MRLLFVLPAYEPAWEFGGIVSATSDLCRELVAQGHDITVYTVSVKPPLSEIRSKELGGVKVVYFPPTQARLGVWDSRSLIDRLDRTVMYFDLVYISAVWQWLGIEACGKCKSHRVPLVVAPHGSLDRVLWRRGRFKKRFYWWLFLRRALRHATAIHLTSPYEASNLVDESLLEKSFLIPNGVDDSIFFVDDNMGKKFRKKHAIPLDAHLVLAVGREDPKKRVDVLIQTLATIPNVNLLVVGEHLGALGRSYRSLAEKLEVSDRVYWLGHLDRERVRDAYNAADVFALISEDENFGMVAVEALACGLPVLLTKTVGVWSLIDDAGVGRSADLKISSIQEELLNCINAPSDAARCRQIAEDRFGIKKVAAEFISSLKTNVIKSAQKCEI